MFRGNTITVPCVPGDKYYTIERVTKTDREIKYNSMSGEPVVIENTKTTGKEIVEHTWHTYTEIVQALEVGRIGKNIFLTKEKAEKKFEKYWEKWW